MRLLSGSLLRPYCSTRCLCSSVVSPLGEHCSRRGAAQAAALCSGARAQHPGACVSCSPQLCELTSRSLKASAREMSLKSTCGAQVQVLSDLSLQQTLTHKQQQQRTSSPLAILAAPAAAGSRGQHAVPWPAICQVRGEVPRGCNASEALCSASLTPECCTTQDAHCPVQPRRARLRGWAVQLLNCQQLLTLLDGATLGTPGNRSGLEPHTDQRWRVPQQLL